MIAQAKPAPQAPHRAQQKISWMPALVLYAAAMGASLPIYALDAIGAVESNPEAYLIALGGCFLVLIPSIIYTCILHLHCWRAVPKAYRATTPGRAVGFLFIPVFNIYWGFITWPKLVDGLKRGGYALPQNAMQHALTLAALVAGSWAALFLPTTPSAQLISLAIDIGALLTSIQLYAPIIKAINRTAR